MRSRFFIFIPGICRDRTACVRRINIYNMYIYAFENRVGLADGEMMARECE